MASGLPVIGANAVALPELIHHNENGYLFEVENKKELVKHLITLFSNTVLRKQMGKKSLEIIQDHSIVNTLEKFETLYASARKNASL